MREKRLYYSYCNVAAQTMSANDRTDHAWLSGNVPLAKGREQNSFRVLLPLLTFALLTLSVNAAGDSQSIVAWRPHLDISTHGKSAWYQVNGPELIFSADYIPVKAAVDYSLKGVFKSGNDESVLAYCGLAQYDKNKALITSTMVTPVTGSTTELLKPASRGDKRITVKSVANWETTMTSKKLVVAFDVDCSGNYADLPNRKLSSVIAGVEQREGSLEVLLENPLDFAVPSGTMVRAHIHGGFLMHCFTIRGNPGAWTPMRALIKPECSLNAPARTFWRSSRFAKVIMDSNRGAGHEDAVLLFRDVSLQAVESKENTVSPKAEPFELNFFPVNPGGTLSTDIVVPPRIVAEWPKAFLFVTISDLDDVAEVEILINGRGPLNVPDDLIDDCFRRSAELPIPLDWLKDGSNKVTFRFADTLDGTTGGFIVHDAKILIKY